MTMEAFLLTTELPYSAWDGESVWLRTQYWMQRLRAGSAMRSHVALLFRYPSGQMVTFDMTSRPSCSFSSLTGPLSWYVQFPNATVYAYPILRPSGQSVFEICRRWEQNPVPYNHELKWVAYFGGCCWSNDEPLVSRGANCTSATLHILAQACALEGKALGLHAPESYFPSAVPRALRRAGVVGEVAWEAQPNLRNQQALPLLNVTEL